MNIASNGTAHKLGFSEVGITDGLVGWWPLNGNANDFSGNSNHGIVSGATVSSGLDQLCYSFDGVDDYIGCGNSSVLNTGSFLSISCFVKVSAFPTTTESNFIDKNGYAQYRMGFTTPGYVHTTIYTTDGVSYQYKNDYGSSYFYPNINQWYHYVFTFGASLISFFVNGVLFGSSPTLYPNIVSSSAPLQFAKYNLGEYFSGKIQDVRIYNRALSADEVNILYELGNSTTKTKISKNTTFIKGEFNELL